MPAAIRASGALGNPAPSLTSARPRRSSGFCSSSRHRAFTALSRHRAFTAALLPIRERVLGRQHPDTLGTRVSRARWTGEAGDAAGARDQFAALLPTYERAFDPDYWNTLNVRKNLAFWTGCAGNPARARDQSAALVPVFERLSARNTRTP
jgi:hypothetical protein